jgi:hypothetical protein
VAGAELRTENLLKSNSPFVMNLRQSVTSCRRSLGELPYFQCQMRHAFSGVSDATAANRVLVAL